jgi:hypothetical protein
MFSFFRRKKKKEPLSRPCELGSIQEPSSGSLLMNSLLLGSSMQNLAFNTDEPLSQDAGIGPDPVYDGWDPVIDSDLISDSVSTSSDPIPGSNFDLGSSHSSIPDSSYDSGSSHSSSYDSGSSHSSSYDSGSSSSCDSGSSSGGCD